MSPTDTPKPIRIFISFLGTGNYEKCCYRFGDEKPCAKHKYIQTVTAKKANCDRVVIFCTQGATEKHGEGLKDEFKYAGLPEPEYITICSGASEKELWSIFNTIRDAIPGKAKVTFDVTHSFRFLPLLMTILLNYLKEVKEVELEKCYYGAWEAKEGNAESVVAPVFDLTPFFVLNDWARAASFLKEAGDSDPLYTIIKERNGRLWKEGKASQDELNFARDLRNSVNTINGQIEAIRTCRGRTIREADKRETFPEAEIERLKNLFPAFVTIYEQLKETYPKYIKNDERNGLLAAKWCADHGMIQQGYTILQETIITLVLEKWSKDPEKSAILKKAGNARPREIANACLSNGGNPEWDESRYGISVDESSCILSGDESIASTHKRLTDTRNDINHAGQRENAAPPDKLQTNLSKFVEGAIKIFGLPGSCHD